MTRLSPGRKRRMLLHMRPLARITAPAVLAALAAACGNDNKVTATSISNPTLTVPFEEDSNDPSNDPPDTVSPTDTGSASGSATGSTGQATASNPTTTTGTDSGDPTGSPTSMSTDPPVTTTDDTTTTTTTNPTTATTGVPCGAVDDALASCMNGGSGFKGALAEGSNISFDGIIAQMADGPDWYSVDFPEAQATGVRPNAGAISIRFDSNPGSAYRLDVFRTCGGPAFADGLALEFGQGAPPATEWTFFDDHPSPGNANWQDDVAWPERVYLRVTRVSDGDECDGYGLTVRRDPS